MRVSNLDFVECGCANNAAAHDYDVKCFFHGSNILLRLLKRNT
jgi:hypothetical protein